MAGSRIGAIISRLAKSRYTELYLLVFAALTILVFRGSTAEGQASLLERWASEYTEVAVVLHFPNRFSAMQLADINSFAAAGFGGDTATVAPTPSAVAGTIQESALLALTPPDSGYLDNFASERSQISEVEVHDGDALSLLAFDYGVSVNSIIWANGLRDADSISPGQILRIPPVSGVIHKVAKGDTAEALAKKYGVQAGGIIAYNHLPQDGALEIGAELVVPDGKMPQAIVAVSTARTGATSVTSAAKTTFGHLPDLGGYFKLPTFGFNWGRIHGRNGVDIANSCGTPIYAAADGTVTVADGDGWNGGFGKYIKISHANGTETLYAHSSKLLVAPGQVVGKGDKIMLMGTTGRSTGCHLHFEVHGARNPLAKY